MNRAATLKFAHREAPWRKQLQLVGVFASLIVFLAVIAGTYLNITARAATIGREIQFMQSEMLTMEQNILDMETTLAELTTAKTMEKRAEDLGYQTIDPENVIYLEVPGYTGRPSAQLAPNTRPTFTPPPQLPAEFTFSLFDWLRLTIYEIGLQNGAIEVFQP